jgi:hypothetical protein
VCYKYCPFGRHHSDAGYDLSDSGLSERRRELLEFPPVFYDEARSAEGGIVRTINCAALRWSEVCSIPGARLCRPAYDRSRGEIPAQPTLLSYCHWQGLALACTPSSMLRRRLLSLLRETGDASLKRYSTDSTVSYQGTPL